MRFLRQSLLFPRDLLHRYCGRHATVLFRISSFRFAVSLPRSYNRLTAPDAILQGPVSAQNERVAGSSGRWGTWLQPGPHRPLVVRVRDRGLDRAAGPTARFRLSVLRFAPQFVNHSDGKQYPKRNHGLHGYTRMKQACEVASHIGGLATVDGSFDMALLSVTSV